MLLYTETLLWWEQVIGFVIFILPLYVLAHWLLSPGEDGDQKIDREVINHNVKVYREKKEGEKKKIS